MNIQRILFTIIKVCEILLFVRIICSWIPGVERQEWFKPLYAITEPVLAPLRRLIPPIGGMFDVSPLIIFFALQFLASLVGRGMH